MAYKGQLKDFSSVTNIAERWLYQQIKVGDRDAKRVLRSTLAN